jgi:hypothetical protein
MFLFKECAREGGALLDTSRSHLSELNSHVAESNSLSGFLPVFCTFFRCLLFFEFLMVFQGFKRVFFKSLFRVLGGLNEGFLRFLKGVL